MDADAPRVSVLMLTYNQEAYLDEAIASVMAQKTTFPFELVIGNDASTDGTTAICNRWAAKFPRRIVVLHHAHNVGLAHNFLLTYARLRGEYVAICEGDDFWLSRHKLQRQVAFLETHPRFVLCFHRVVNYYEADGSKSLSNGGQRRRELTLLDLARANVITNVSALFRRSAVPVLPAWFAAVETYDYPLYMLAATRGDLYYMSRPMAVYRQRAGAIWSRAQGERKRALSLRVRRQLIAHFAPTHPQVCELLEAACQAIERNYDSAYAGGAVRTRTKQFIKRLRGWLSRSIPLRRIG
ncbi:MAG: glycosyltransferase [Prevotellaceae bacterium]|jgi:glycosyltransferase involved in cell wall biosynthesis|nr:glycosyltransferase [Prevotellaceae bacterium]